MSFKVATEPVPLGYISGFCPFGCGQTLSVRDGGHIVCCNKDCDNPTGIDQLLNAPLDHYVVFTEEGFTVEHTLRERINGTMAACELQHELVNLPGMPVDEPGRYRAIWREAGGFSYWDFVPAE